MSDQPGLPEGEWSPSLESRSFNANGIRVMSIDLDLSAGHRQMQYLGMGGLPEFCYTNDGTARMTVTFEGPMAPLYALAQQLQQMGMGGGGGQDGR